MLQSIYSANANPSELIINHVTVGKSIPRINNKSFSNFEGMKPFDVLIDDVLHLFVINSDHVE